MVRLLTGLNADGVVEQTVQSHGSDSEPPPDVSFVIPTRNRADFVPECVTLVLAEPGPPREVIVVDSSEDEKTIQALERFPSVRLLRIPGGRDNRHAAKNAGLARARGRVVCFLDDDSRVQPGWLVKMLSHYQDPTVGAVGGRIIDDNYIDGPKGESVGGLEPNGRLTLNFTRHTGELVEVKHFVGCNTSFRREALLQTGGYDTHYGGPNFMEETDLCLRVGRAEYRVLFDPDAVVRHLSAPRDTGMQRRALDPRLEFWTARSRAYFNLKLMPRNWAVFRYGVLAFLAQHAKKTLRGGEPGHLRALLLQACGLVLGACDWIGAGCPRVAERSDR